MKTAKEIEFEQNRKLINLYRKNRDIELQKKIEKIFLETDNTALRIKLIEKLDEKNKKIINNSSVQQKVKNKENIKKKLPEKNNLKTPLKDFIIDKEKVQFKNFLVNFLERTVSLLGLNQKIKRFVKTSKALEYSPFKFSLSNETLSFFSTVKETKITNILRLFDYFKKDGWLSWDPYTYNYFYNLSLFLNEFFEVKFWLKKDLDLEQCIKKTLKMQYHYAVYLNEKTDQKEIIDKGKNFMLQNREFIQKQNLLSEIFYLMDSLEKSNIKLAEIIQTFYICHENKMFYWKDIVKRLQPTPIDKKRFNNQDKSFQSKVSLRILKVKNTIKEIEKENSYIESIKKDYLTFKDNKINIDFIEEIILEHIKIRYYHTKNNKLEQLKKLYLSNPMYLLEIILKHIINHDSLINSETQFLNPLNKKITTSKILDVPEFYTIFQKLKDLKQSLGNFIKQNNNFKYSFEDIENRTTSSDKKYLEILEICDKFIDHCWKLAKSFSVILKNHSQALSKFKKQNENAFYPDKIIEKIENKPKFIPYYNHKILNQSQLKQTNIPDIFHSFTKLLYSSIYIYKDNYLLKYFDKKHIIAQKIDLQKLYKEYKRLTQKEYEKE